MYSLTLSDPRTQSNNPVIISCVCVHREETHKVDVIKFAQNKAQECLRNDDLMDKDSAFLIWEFIVLLCRQNGVSVCAGLTLTKSVNRVRLLLRTQVRVQLN